MMSCSVWRNCRRGPARLLPVPVPDYQTLMLPLLRLADLQGAVSIKTAVAAMIEEFHLSPDDVALMVPSGAKPLIRSRADWAVTYLVHAGLLERPERAHFLTTAAGRAVLKDPPAKIDLVYLSRYPAFLEFTGKTKAPDAGTTVQSAVTPADLASPVVTPEEQLEASYRLLRTDIESQVLDRLRNAKPEFFERAVLGLLRQMGYGAAGDDAMKHLGKSGDEGVDGVIHQDELKLESIYVQAKRNAEANTVSREQVQAFVGSLVGKNADKGVFFTTSTFSAGAIAYAAGIHQNVILIDGAKLARLMFDRGVGVRTEGEYVVKTVDEAYFEED